MGAQPRPKNPAGFEIYECWGEFLDTQNRMALALFEDCFDGVRIMAKFDEYFNQPQTFAKWVRRAEIAKQMGKKIHLCIDWHNTATGPNDYHDYVQRPTLNKLAKAVGAIIKEFPNASIVEVANEPYYVQNAQQRITIKEYHPLVLAYIDGCSIGNHKGILLASQSSKGKWNKPGNKVEDGWEWSDTRWQPGMWEGLHTAVLHTHTTPNDLIAALTDHWYQGKAIGYQHEIYESELAPTGKLLKTNTTAGAQMYSAVLNMARQERLPICFLTIDGRSPNFGASGNWPGAMGLVNAYE